MVPSFPAAGYAIDPVAVDPMAGLSEQVVSDALEQHLPDLQEGEDAVKVCIDIESPHSE